MTHYDVVIIGAGHNGLTAANYLSRAGKKVCVLEARPVVGGACVTEELVPGAKWSSCSFVQGMLRPEIIEELELGRFGLKSIAPDVQGLALWEDGDHVMLHKDVDATLKSIEAHSRPDGRGFFEFGARLKRFADISRDWLLSDPPSRAEVFARFEAAGEAELLNEFMLMPAGDLLGRYIASERLRGYMMFLGMVSIWAARRRRRHPMSTAIMPAVNSRMSLAGGRFPQAAWARSPRLSEKVRSITAPPFGPRRRSWKFSSAPVAQRA